MSMIADRQGLTRLEWLPLLNGALESAEAVDPPECVYAADWSQNLTTLRNRRLAAQRLGEIEAEFLALGPEPRRPQLSDPITAGMTLGDLAQAVTLLTNPAAQSRADLVWRSRRHVLEADRSQQRSILRKTANPAHFERCAGLSNDVARLRVEREEQTRAFQRASELARQIDSGNIALLPGENPPNTPKERRTLRTARETEVRRLIKEAGVATREELDRQISASIAEEGRLERDRAEAGRKYLDPDDMALVGVE